MGRRRFPCFGSIPWRQFVPPEITDGYVQKMRENHGKRRLYRTAVVERGGHCTFSVAENAAAVETLVERIETGRWPVPNRNG